MEAVASSSGRFDVSDNEDWCHDVRSFYESMSGLSYSDEYQMLFEHDEYLQRLRLCTVRGCIQTNRFRSLMWRLFLEVLPPEQTLWYGAVLDHRTHYSQLKKTVMVKPPLHALQSAAENSENPWNQYVHDKKVMDIIKIDVKRLHFNGVDNSVDSSINEFFHDKRMQRMMRNILFCCAKDNSRLGYMQGMHDMLAVIIWVFHCDQLAYQNADDTSRQSLGVSVGQLFDEDQLESDAYMLFFHLSQSLATWCDIDHTCNQYFQTSHLPVADVRLCRRLSGARTPMSKLLYIHSRLLKHFSPELHQHFRSFDAYPPVFGFRWLLVLFTREFTVTHDLPVLWDGIFADGFDLDLVDYIFVAILLFFKDKFLSQSMDEYFDILLKDLPTDFNVQRFVKDAQLLRNQFLNDIATIKVLGWENISVDDIDGVDSAVPSTETGQLQRVNGSRSRVIKLTDWPSEIGEVPERLTQSSEPNTADHNIRSQTEKLLKATAERHSFLPTPVSNDPAVLRDELVRVSQKLSDLEYSSNLCCRGLDFWTGVLQHHLMKDEAADAGLQEDDVKAAVCGLKEVSFRLKSAVSRSSFFHLLEMEEAQSDFRNISVREFPLTYGLSQMFLQSNSTDDALTSSNNDSD